MVFHHCEVTKGLSERSVFSQDSFTLTITHTCISPQSGSMSSFNMFPAPHKFGVATTHAPVSTSPLTPYVSMVQLTSPTSTCRVEWEVGTSSTRSRDNTWSWDHGPTRWPLSAGTGGVHESISYPRFTQTIQWYFVRLVTLQTPGLGRKPFNVLIMPQGALFSGLVSNERKTTAEGNKVIAIIILCSPLVKRYKYIPLYKNTALEPSKIWTIWG